VAGAEAAVAGTTMAHSGMTTDAHEERFLARLRAKLVTSPRPPHPGPRPPAGRAEGGPAGGGVAGVPTAEAPDPQPLVERFARELAVVGGRAEYCATPEDLASRLAAACREAGVNTVVLEADPRWALPGMLPWRQAVEEAVERIDCELIVPGDRGPHREAAAQAGAGLTIADFAVADTGTVGLWTGPGRARVTSLLPPVHLVLLPLAALVATRAEALRRLAVKAEQEGWPSQVMFITGPSRTGDIEGELTVGVHGPGQVLVFIVPAAGGAHAGR